jgi:hypothetical protein
MFNNFFLNFEIHAVYEAMWKYTLERTATGNNMTCAHLLLSKYGCRRTLGI